MPRRENTAKKDEVTQCDGGNSYNCRREPHDEKRRVFCYRCDTLMGCEACCERPSELICLNCRNWATQLGVRRHGSVIPSRKVPLVNTDSGWKKFEGEFDQINDVLRSIDEIASENIRSAEI